MLNDIGIQTCSRCGGSGEERSHKQSIVVYEKNVPMKWCSCYIDEKCRYPENLHKCKTVFKPYFPCRICDGEGTITWLDKVFNV